MRNSVLVAFGFGSALTPKEMGLSSNAAPTIRILALSAGLAMMSPLSAQDDEGVTVDAEAAEPEADNSEEAERPAPINLTVTVPRGEVSEAQVMECEDSEEAATISGEIVICRRIGESGENYFSGSREEARKRYARETAFKGSPPPPNLFGIPNHGNAIGIGGVPPPALIIDVGALPEAPAGSDADRIARGLPPLGQDEDLSEEEIRQRREALGLPPPKFEQEPE